MNERNIRWFNQGVNRVAEWSDRALDDDDRSRNDSIIITVRGKADEVTDQDLLTELVNEYDEWISRTRGPMTARRQNNGRS